MTETQKDAASQLRESAVKADGPGGRHMASTGQFPGPYDFLLRSPVLATRWRQHADYLRFDSSLPQRLNELAILVQARYWTAQFEWWAHAPLALRAGLSPTVVEDVRLGRRPGSMERDEAAVYDFCVELMDTRLVSDATLLRLRSQLSDQQVVDLVAVSGFYTTVSMVLNTTQPALPDGEELPLPPLT